MPSPLVEIPADPLAVNVVQEDNLSVASQILL